MLWCAHCRRHVKRDDMRVNAPERTLLADGRRAFYATHVHDRPCNKRTIISSDELAAAEGLDGAGTMSGMQAARR